MLEHILSGGFARVQSVSDMAEQSKELSPNDYERLVTKIMQSQLGGVDGASMKMFRNKKYLGKSGQYHEIDVAIEIAFGSMDILVLVECKRHNRPVGVEDVMTLKYRLSDIAAHKGIVVSTNGFQSGTLRIARAERIALVRASGARCVEWRLGAFDETERELPRALMLVPDFSTRTGTVAVAGRTRTATNAVWAECGIADATDVFFSPGEASADEREDEIVVFG